MVMRSLSAKLLMSFRPGLFQTRTGKNVDRSIAKEQRALSLRQQRIARMRPFSRSTRLKKSETKFG